VRVLRFVIGIVFDIGGYRGFSKVALDAKRQDEKTFAGSKRFDRFPYGGFLLIRTGLFKSHNICCRAAELSIKVISFKSYIHMRNAVLVGFVMTILLGANFGQISFEQATNSNYALVHFATFYHCVP
jgi:hypothetical protein